MRISFLLGPAGSGKTFRCLREIRSELARDPQGAPLIFLAPKQATFQLERQLLENGEIQGYSRLHILSFERLARLIFKTAGRSLPAVISEQGRAMVLRALLNRVEPQLSIFAGAAKRQGFPEQLSRQLREFANDGLTPKRLRDLSALVPQRNGLPEKLRDFALLFEKFRDWLMVRQLEDGDALLGAAADLLDTAPSPALAVSGLWVDGFAQLTPEERRLLVSLLRVCDQSTLAFCVEADKTARSPISPWYLVSHTLSKCKAEIETRYGQKVCVEVLDRSAPATRFSHSPALRQLEQQWGRFETNLANIQAGDAVGLYECADPEAEATCAAREIIRSVRAGARFRESAVLVRDFNNDYPHVLRRVFRRYGIPFFIDHRENVAHHPLAELTRGAVRTIAFDWEQRDWFTVLKSGLVRLSADELDQMENAALAFGWRGAAWRGGLSVPKDPSLEAEMNRRREKIMPPFLALSQVLQERPNGRVLAQALRSFWRELRVEEQLENWSRESAGDALHATVWDQMNAWLDDVTLAFADQPLYLRQWIPILEAGLSSLSVGVIPPVLDEVLIGSVDRSRNPDLKLLCILGFNEKVFPAVPGQETLLTEEDRDLLLATGSDLASAPSLKLAAEQFYGYIACTRARQRLCISYARTGLDGSAQNPSRFVAQLTRVFPDLQPLSWNYPSSGAELLHRCELPWLGIHSTSEALFTPDPHEKLTPEVARQLYGANLNLAVSRLERFASCPFRFFVERGLRVKERDEFTLDIREQGSFQHAVLAQFHQRLQSENKEWRDLTPAEGREMIRSIAEEQISTYHDGLLLASHEHRFTAENYQASLQEFIHVLIEWFRQTNQFSPARVEFEFGLKSPLPGWKVGLADGASVTVEGIVDRIDLFEISETEAVCVIVDYKSGWKKPDRLLVHYGIQQQLTAYLVALTKIPEVAAAFGYEKLHPAGGFLLPLGAHYDSARTRKQIAEDEHTARRSAYLHNGVFDFQYLRLLDAKAPAEKSGQFYYTLTPANRPHAGSFTVLKTEEFAHVLDRTESVIREFGERIHQGDIAVRPFKKGAVTACDQCSMHSICRFDSWVQPYEILRKPEKASTEQ